MKIVYIAGPYIGDGHYLTVDRNIREAEAFAIKLTERGIGWICPHLNSQHFHLKTSVPAQFWYEMDLHILSNCDAIAFSPRWQGSAGCKLEMELAQTQEIPILYWDDLEQWALEYAEAK